MCDPSAAIARKPYMCLVLSAVQLAAALVLGHERHESLQGFFGHWDARLPWDARPKGGAGGLTGL
jgi:hypothetical protein